VANAPVSYVRYLGKMLWPTNLAPIYPHPASRYFLSDQWPEWQVWVAALLLVFLSALGIAELRRRPYLAVGWFWFFGMMIPVIGLVQVGEQAMADRYTYLPLIGPTFALVWLFSELARSLPVRLPLPKGDGKAIIRTSQAAADDATSRRPGSFQFSFPRPSPLQLALTVLTLLALSACAVLTRHQLHYWRDTVALFEHTVDVTADNPGAQFTLGVGLEEAGRPDLATIRYRIALAISPRLPEAHQNLGQLLGKRGYTREAVQHYLIALQLNSKDIASRLNLAGVLMHSGQVQTAVRHFEEALRINPDSVEALNNLAWLFATSEDPAFRDGPRAVQLAQHACELTAWKQTILIGTLAAAYAEAGRFAEAIATAERACASASQKGEQTLLERNRQLLELYRAGKPDHEPTRETR
jgi:Tfp pilus assembly protein PilF